MEPFELDVRPVTNGDFFRFVATEPEWRPDRVPPLFADARLPEHGAERRGDPGELAFVLVSIDPERDTVQRVRRFGDQTRLTELGWTLLRGDPPQVRADRSHSRRTRS